MLREKDHAGTWYPELEQECRSFLEIPPAFTSKFAQISGALIPHAGWTHAGRVAMGTLKTLQEQSEKPERLILIGAHMEKGDAPRVMIEGGFDTPLGPILIDEKCSQDIAMSQNADVETPDDYFDDNALEVITPMIKFLWPDVPVIAIGVPPSPNASRYAADICALLKSHKIKNAIAIATSDLTHYGPNYNFKPQGLGQKSHDWVMNTNDQVFLNALLEMNAQKMLWTAERERNACSAGAAIAAMTIAQKFGATQSEVLVHSSSLLEKRSSDAPTSFVSYVGAVFGKGGN